MRWLLLDDIERIEKGKRAVAQSRVPAAEYSREVLMTEMMAQTGAVLLGAESDYQKDMVFAKIEFAEFLPPYQAGQRLRIEATAEGFRPEGAWIDGVIRTGDREVARGRLLLMQLEGLIPGHGKPVTFHQEFMEHFKVREKVA